MKVSELFEVKKPVKEGYDTSEKNREHHDDYDEWLQAVRRFGGAADDSYESDVIKAYAFDGLCGEFNQKTNEGWVVDKGAQVRESADHLEDAIRDNWLSTPNSKILKILKDKIKGGEKEWQYLRGKSDEDLEDLIDDAKYQARNQYD